jgi:hypothetical protein
MAYLQMKWQLTNDLGVIIKELAPAAALIYLEAWAAVLQGRPG